MFPHSFCGSRTQERLSWILLTWEFMVHLQWEFGGAGIVGLEPLSGSLRDSACQLPCAFLKHSDPRALRLLLWHPSKLSIQSTGQKLPHLLWSSLGSYTASLCLYSRAELEKLFLVNILRFVGHTVITSTATCLCHWSMKAALKEASLSAWVLDWEDTWGWHSLPATWSRTSEAQSCWTPVGSLLICNMNDITFVVGNHWDFKVTCSSPWLQQNEHLLSIHRVYYNGLLLFFSMA